MIVETSIFESFFTLAEIDYISAACPLDDSLLISSSNGGSYYSVPAKVDELINEKIPKLPNEHFFIHLFDSNTPCGPHADINPPQDLTNVFDPTVLIRTIIIPLDTYESGTAVFEQTLDYNQTALDIINFPLLHQTEHVPKLFQHLGLEHIRRLTLEELFFWNKGSMLIFDRKKVHCSTMFPEGMTNKKALVIWTQLKK